MITRALSQINRELSTSQLFTLIRHHHSHLSFVFVILFFLSSNSSYTQTWKTLDNIQLDYYNISRFETAGDSLIIFGGFRTEETGDEVLGVLTWDSISISSFGSYIDWGPVHCGLQYQDEYYIGGKFSDYNDDYYQRKVARWNGLEWNPLGLGVWDNMSKVKDMEVYQGKLVMGGLMRDVEGDSLFWTDLAYWQDSTWHTMGGTYGDGDVEELIQYDDKLFVVGDFYSVSADNSTENTWLANNVVWWDGTEWGQPDEGVVGHLNDAYVDTLNNHLYVVGNCSNASGLEVSNVAMWDGTEWHAMPDDLDGQVHCITMYRGQLYVGGYGVFGPYSVAYFDGVEWQQIVMQNIDGSVREMIVYKDELYMGGTFDHAGGLEVDGLVRYYLHPDSVQWGVPDNVGELEQEQKVFVYPNPANEYIKISGDERALVNATFSLYSSSGQRVLYQEKLYRDIMVDVSGLKAGSYAWEIVREEEEIGVGVLIVR